MGDPGILMLPHIFDRRPNSNSYPASFIFLLELLRKTPRSRKKEFLNYQIGVFHKSYTLLYVQIIKP